MDAMTIWLRAWLGFSLHDPFGEFLGAAEAVLAPAGLGVAFLLLVALRPRVLPGVVGHPLGALPFVL